MKRIAIIPARGGSKRIPGKNIKEFCGKPVIAYSIQAALDSGLFDTVMVSTDSEKIAEVARQYGAEVPFMRSEQASSDFATTRDVLLEVLTEYKKLGKEFDRMLCLYPGAPFVTGQRLIEAFKLLDEPDTTMVFPVCKFSDSPYRAFFVDDGGYIQYQYPELKNERTQDLPALYHDCGQFYAYNLKAYFDDELSYKNWKPLITPEEECQDIDTPADWALAEYKYRILHKI